MRIINFSPSPRFLTFLYLPVHAFWMLLCPSTLSYDWQTSSIPVLEDIADVRVVAIAAFYVGIVANLIKRSLKKKRGKSGLGTEGSRRPQNNATEEEERVSHRKREKE